jgi:DNA-binding HxlR family transcriptional regulator
MAIWIVAESTDAPLALSQGIKALQQIAKLIDGVSQRMLTLTLKSLERDGLVTRTMYPTIPPRVDYNLTERGQTLIEPLSALPTRTAQNRPSRLRGENLIPIRREENDAESSWIWNRLSRSSRRATLLSRLTARVPRYAVATEWGAWCVFPFSNQRNRRFHCRARGG